MKKLLYLMLATMLCNGCFQTSSRAAIQQPYKVAPGARGVLLYVSPNGSDKDAGSEQQPLATIQEALKRVTPDSVIRLLPGVWHTTLTVDYKGSAEMPLTIEGARDSDGNWLSVLDASAPVVPSQWKARPEVGPNTYSISVEKVGSMLVDGKSVAPLHKEVGNDSQGKRLHTAAQVLAWPDEQTVHYRNVDIPFWKTIGGVYSEWVVPNETVLRLADGSNPAKHKVTLGASGAVVKMDGSRYVTLKGVEIQGAEFGVEISGKGAIGNSVEECFIRNGRRRVLVGNGAQNTQVIGNRIEMGFIGHLTGAWGESNYAEGQSFSDEEKAEAAQKFFVYAFFKYWASGVSISDDVSIMTDRGSSDTLIKDNRLKGGLIGIGIYNDSKKVTVVGNDVQYFSSVGTVVRGGVDTVTYDGNFFYDCNINARLHQMNLVEPARKIWFVRNTSMQPKGMGTHVFNHFNPGPNPNYPEHQVVSAHNTFLGGARGMMMPKEVQTGKGFPGYSFVNNRFIGCETVFWAAKEFIDKPENLGGFDYNQVIGGVVNRHGTPVWQGKHCIVGESIGDWKWDENHITSPIPANDPGHNAGVDISQPYILDKTGPVQFPAVPGFKPGYFGGPRPNLGAPLPQR